MLRVVFVSCLNFLIPEWIIYFLLCLLTGKNWDVSAALNDFEQIRQVHAGHLPPPFSEGSSSSKTPEKGCSDRECARPSRPTLQRQDDVIQGTGLAVRAVCVSCVGEKERLLAGLGSQ